MSHRHSRDLSPVPIDIVGRGLTLTAKACDAVERHLTYALGRFLDGLRRIRVTLLNERAPRGGDGKRCRIEMHVSRRAPVFVMAWGADLDLAVVKAAHVAARRLDDLHKR